MNRLNKSCCYISGGMDRVPDGGVQWRSWITPKLQEMGIGVLNPCDKPIDFAHETHDFRERISLLKEEGKYEQVRELMKPVCAVDLRLVDIAHFIILKLDVDIHLAGSYHEIVVAIGQKKPVLVMCEKGIHNIPNWWFGVIPYQMFFDNWDNLFEYLKQVDNGEAEHLNRWRFLNWEKVYGHKQ